MANRKDTATVAILIDDLGYGGAQNQLNIILPELPDTIVPQVYCMSEITDPFGPRLRASGIEVFSFRRRSGWDVARYLSLKRTLKRERVDVVHGFLDAANVYAYSAARALGVPSVLSLRNDRILLSGPRAHLLRRALRRAALVVVNSTAGMLHLRDQVGVPAERVSLVPNGVRVPSSAIDDRSSHGHTIGFVGRFENVQKRIDALVRAFAQLEHSGVRLVLVGDGPDRAALEELSGALGVKERVEFTGAVPDPGTWLGRLDALVLPSAFEGMPNTVLEALAVGTPVITTASGDVKEAVIDGRTGIVVSDASPETLARAIDRLLDAPGLAANTRIEGPKLMRERFSTTQSAAALVAAYHQVLPMRCTPAPP